LQVQQLASLLYSLQNPFEMILLQLEQQQLELAQLQLEQHRLVV
jgi:hypothetical protein